MIGHGEVCPLGPFYLPAYAEGVRAGLRELGPPLLGEDPRQLLKLNRAMDAALKGHPYEECLAVRRQIPHPFVLDETIDELGVLESIASR